MKPRVTMSTKISVVTAQKMNVCCGSAGPNSPMLQEPCQTTGTTDNARTKNPKPSRNRFFNCGDIYLDYTWVRGVAGVWRGIGPALETDATAPAVMIRNPPCRSRCARTRKLPGLRQAGTTGTR